MKRYAGTALSLAVLLLFIGPMITVYLFDCFTFSIHPFYDYLNPLYLYVKLFSETKYLVVCFCLDAMIFMLMTRRLGFLQNRDEHGSAKWASDHEISRIFNKRSLYRLGMRGGKKSPGGMVVKKVGQTIWYEMQCIHSIIIGTTSSGKTRKTLIPSIMIASQAVSSEVKVLRIKVLSSRKYAKHLERMQIIETFRIGNFDVLYCLMQWKQRKLKKLYKIFHLAYPKKIVIEKGKQIDLKSYFDIRDLEDINVRYSFDGNAQLMDESILCCSSEGKIRVRLKLDINKESFFVNDPKKELYKMMRNYLVKQGYDVYLLDLRKQWTGDQWNPMTSVVRCLKENKTDEADMYAKDIAAALCPESKMSEKLWTDGERAIIAALILAVAGADCDDSQKNLYTCYQILNTLGQPDEDDHVALNDFFNNLPVGNVARTAFGPAALATDRTRMSFYVSASATLGMFSSSLVAKQTSRSSFDITKFSSRPTAIFLINPDEKSSMDSLARLFIDEIYRVLSFEANKTGGRLPRKFHYFWDETASTGKLNDLPKKLSISRGRNQQWHLYLQDFGQLEEIYGKEVTQTIKANCNLMIYISTQNLETAKEISDKIGSRTIETESVSEQTGESVFIMPHGNVSRSLMARPLLNANELMKLEDGKAVVIRMRMNPMLTTLPDCSEYDFYDLLDYYLEEPERHDEALIPYIPDIRNEFEIPKPLLNIRMNKKI